ncbi:mannose-6-phosphate isomerase [Candidatus Adlerbacteria bacterium RIFOXYC1_FULL_48_26]|uniref:Mannose-6-phosphate isomerase n=1 Tax=Candidatus Adlerbacteria bacterium RIFOXYC1_FULL_48_26 TaxID=1797247 RepID=A0A1F4Y4A9_9BACT|nr:MAG: mannose-6-phosphate isomerase [Candidatus Adlerbacteria bacterium RIFOXYC1_FULL_48_26]OGC93575.1 MAG: mannose-6-phosphate isomerase [Candidatus Adlerbacteria bacterium RIFOXYB1_FULL_48_10]OGC95620.1 MAG: mannose-6-phosphate isomerase [Candidatus Adlerbacteria bacterium RIFOXYD1_FULL_48_8]
MEHLPNFRKEERPWGNFEQFTANETSTVKLITVREGESISLQTHQHRSEYWRVVSGNGVVTIGSEELPATIGAEFYIEQGVAHRLTGGNGGLCILEIAFGTFDENDITRLEDKYGRA